VRRRGHLYWSNLDKRRPALVISIDARNDHATDVIVIPCSTHLRESPTHVRLGRNEGGLLQPSMLKCEQITTIPRVEVDELAMGPALSGARLREVERAIARSIGLPA
jgi:mRNA-degrading endonuclease toxin of MazEF toxin-antitoxin module